MLTSLFLFLACQPGVDETTPEQTTNTVQPQAQVAVASPAPQLIADDTIVASWNGGQLNYGDGTQAVKGQLTQMEAEYLSNRYQIERNSVEQIAIDKILEMEAAASGQANIEALMQIEIVGKAEAATEEEITAFYEEFKERLQNAPLDQVRPIIEGQLSRQKQSERFQVYITELKTKYGFKLELPAPNIPRIEVSADDDPFIGPEDAQITIIQFAEFQCPYCGKAGEAVDKVMETYPGKVKMVYRDFPLGFHDRAIPAAVAANCAGEQGKYWEMHNLLMSNQRALEEETLISHASSLSIDMEKWNTCRADPSQEAEVKKDMEDGAAVGVTGTPAFFINGIMLSGAQPFEAFKEIIDRELERG
jgi:protein-disulfide isomerase